MQMKKVEGSIDVYKKKLREMGNLRTELILSQEHVQKLNMDIQDL